MPASFELITLFAQPGGGWGHPWGPGGGWFWLWGPFSMLLWVGLIAATVWLVARGVRPRERSGVERARDVLADRYARGELTTEEYRERLEQLR